MRGLQCLSMNGNRHRWKLSIENQDVIKLLEGTADQLRNTWQWEARNPKSYPLNSSYVISTTKSNLRGDSPRKLSKIAYLTKPRHFSELLPEVQIKATYEDHNSGSYEEALAIACEEPTKESWAAFQKILRAMERVYLASYFGVEMLPAPKVNFLHRKLLEIADLAGLGDLTYAGLVEFLNDLCPCGKKHTKEAIRKLRKRLP